MAIVMPGLERRLKAELSGDVGFDRFTRGRYATDASHYQVTPVGVVAPRTIEEAERAIEWSEKGVRLSPFDSWAWAAFDAQAMSHLLRGRYEEAWICASKACRILINACESILETSRRSSSATAGCNSGLRCAENRTIGSV